MKVEQVMSRPVITCRPTDTLDTAAGLMWEGDCGALPVVDHDGIVVGVVTDRDICMAAYTAGKDLRSIPVSTAMAKIVIACLPTDELGNAEAIMSRGQVRRLPVVDGHARPIGIISMNDIARVASRLNRGAALAIATMAAICEPRRRRFIQAA